MCKIHSGKNKILFVEKFFASNFQSNIKFLTEKKIYVQCVLEYQEKKTRGKSG